MNKYEALFEDEDDIFAGTPESRYWDIAGQLSQDLLKDEFDGIVERLAVMESIISKTHDYESIDNMIKQYAVENYQEIEELKKSVYMELAGQLVYRVAE
jgi:hypothetical protein